MKFSKLVKSSLALLLVLMVVISSLTITFADSNTDWVLKFKIPYGAGDTNYDVDTDGITGKMSYKDEDGHDKQMDYLWKLDPRENNGDPGWSFVHEPGHVTTDDYFYDGQGICYFQSGGGNTFWAVPNGLFTNPAQCVIPFARMEGGTVSPTNNSLYFLSNASLRARVFYYMTPAMDGNIQRMEEADPVYGARVSTNGYYLYTTAEQQRQVMTIAKDWAEYWYPRIGMGSTRLNTLKAVLNGNYSQYNITSGDENVSAYGNGQFLMGTSGGVTYGQMFYFLLFMLGGTDGLSYLDGDEHDGAWVSLTAKDRDALYAWGHGYESAMFGAGWGDFMSNATANQKTAAKELIDAVCDYEYGVPNSNHKAVTDVTPNASYSFSSGDGNTSRARFPDVPPEAGVFYFYPSNGNRVSGTDPAEYYQVYMSSALIRIPVTIEKQIDSNGTVNFGNRTAGNHNYLYDLNQIRFKIYQTSGCVDGEAMNLSPMSGLGTTTTEWDAFIPDEYLDAADNSIKLGSDGKVTFYVTRWSTYKSRHIQGNNSDGSPYYYIKEIVKGTGYEDNLTFVGVNQEPGTFNGNQNSSNSVAFAPGMKARVRNNVITVSDPIENTTFKIKKVDAKTNTPLSHVKFKLYDSNTSDDSKLIGEVETNNNGEASWSGLLYGKYRLVEDEASLNQYHPGYVVDPLYAESHSGYNIEITAGSSASTIKVNGQTIQNAGAANQTAYKIGNTYKQSIKVIKKDSNTGEVLPGAVFGLYTGISQNGSNYEGTGLIETKTTDSSGVAQFDNLGNGDYYLIELSPPDGYKINPKYTAEYLDNHEDAAGHIILTSPDASNHVDYITNPIIVLDEVNTDGVTVTLNKTFTFNKTSGPVVDMDKLKGILSDSEKGFGQNVADLYNPSCLRFSFYTDSKCTQPLHCYVGESSTEQDALNLQLDSAYKIRLGWSIPATDTANHTIYIKESYANGFSDANSPFHVSTGTTYRATVSKNQPNGSVTINNIVRLKRFTIAKKDASDNSYLGDAVFKVESNARTWYFKTPSSGNTPGRVVCAPVSNRDYQYLNSGDYVSDELPFADTPYEGYFPYGANVTITEVKAPEGYALDSTPQTLELPRNSAAPQFTFNDTPNIGLKLTKTEAGNPSVKLSGAKYRLEYYDDHYDSLSDLDDKTPTAVYHFVTNSDGEFDTRVLESYSSPGRDMTYNARHGYVSDLNSDKRGLFPSGHTYVIIEEQAPGGYEIDDTPLFGYFSGDVVNVSHSDIKLFNVSGVKHFYDNNNSDNKRPSSDLYILLYQRVKGTSSWGTSPVKSALLVRNCIENFIEGEDPIPSYTFSGLPRGYFDSSNNYHEYEYKIVEASYHGSYYSPVGSPYTVIYKNHNCVYDSGSGSPVYDQERGAIVTTASVGHVNGSEVQFTETAWDGNDVVIDIDNIYEPETVVLNVTKTWDDSNDLSGKRPSSVTFNVYRSYDYGLYYTNSGVTQTKKKLVGTYTVDAAHNWTTSISSVDGHPLYAYACSAMGDNPAEDAGTDWNGLRYYTGMSYTYSVEEVSVPGYETSEISSTHSTSGNVTTWEFGMTNTMNLYPVTIQKDIRNENGTQPAGNVGFALFNITNTNASYAVKGTGSAGSYNRTENIAVTKTQMNSYKKFTAEIPSSYTMYTNSSGRLVINDLEPGSYYLFETVTPSGYMPYKINNKPIAFVVSDTGETQIFDAAETHQYITYPYIHIVNDAVMMPSTGGSGMALYYALGIFGFALMAMFAIVVIRRRKSKGY